MVHSTTVSTPAKLRPHRLSLGSRPILASLHSMSTPQKVAVGRRYKTANAVVPRMVTALVLCYAIGLCLYFGKYRIRPRHHHAPDLPAVLREGEIEASSARRLLCSAAVLRAGGGLGGGGADGGGGGGAGVNDGSSYRVKGVSGGGGDNGVGNNGDGGGDGGGVGDGKRRAIKRGRFLGPTRSFAPLPEGVLNSTDSRVFLLTGASAANTGTRDLLAHFITHYSVTGGIPREHILVVVHTRGDVDAEPTREIVNLLNARG